MQVPHIFSPGFPAKSREVNENFAALADAITRLETQVAALQGANVGIPGEYSVLGYQTGLIPAGAGAVIEGIVYTGDLTLAAGGGLTLTLREFKNELHVGQPASNRVFKSTTESITGTWSDPDDAALALHLEGEQRPLRFARGGPRLFIGNSLNGADGSTVMLFLVRRGG
jgi:hypothetical protein